MKSLLVFFAATLCAAPADEIRAVLDRQVADWNRADVRAFMRGYANSPEVTFVGKTVEKGYDAILQRYLRTYAGVEKMGKLRFSDIVIRTLGPDHALILGRFHLERGSEAGGNATGLFSLVMSRTSEGWKIIHDHTS